MPPLRHGFNGAHSSWSTQPVSPVPSKPMGHALQVRPPRPSGVHVVMGSQLPLLAHGSALPLEDPPIWEDPGVADDDGAGPLLLP